MSFNLEMKMFSEQLKKVIKKFIRKLIIWVTVLNEMKNHNKTKSIKIENIIYLRFAFLIGFRFISEQYIYYFDMDHYIYIYIILLTRQVVLFWFFLEVFRFFFFQLFSFNLFSIITH